LWVSGTPNFDYSSWLVCFQLFKLWSDGFVAFCFVENYTTCLAKVFGISKMMHEKRAINNEKEHLE